MKKQTQGFTLIEIMIVVMIIGMLAGLAIPSFRKAIDHTREKSCIGNLRVIHGAVTMYATEYHKGSPNVITDEDWTFILNFMDDSTPTCPQGNASYTKPANYGSFPVCPNAGEFPGHAHPGT